MSILDQMVGMGKKVLPPPTILLFSHIIFCVFGTICLCLNLMSSPDIIWSSYVTLFIGGLPLCLGIAFIKYKQTNSIIAAIISGIVFFCTIVAIQYWPWSAWINTLNKATAFNFMRLIVLMPLLIVYGLWSKKEIEKFVYRPVRLSPKQTDEPNDYAEVDYDEVFDGDQDDKPKSNKPKSNEDHTQSSDSFL